MPLYEYVCGKCGRKTELIQRYGDKPPHCPNCGGKVRKAFSAPAIQFKGSGWYVTDYGPGASRAGKSDSASDSEKKSDAGEKSEKTAATEKSGKSDKSEKSEKSGKSEKSEKSDKSDRKRSSKKGSES